MNGNLGSFIPLILIIVLMYFLMIRPQNKKDKEVKAMRDSLKVGDEVITIGGICGKVVKTSDDSVVLAVGADKVKMEFKKWAISSNTSQPQPAKGKAAPAETKEEAPAETSKKPKKLGKKAEEPAEEPKEEPAPAKDAE